MPIIKNVSARVHSISIADTADLNPKGEPKKKMHRILPGQTIDVPEDMHAKIMASPSGRGGELVDWDRPMPKPEGMSLTSLDDEKALLAVGTCKDQDILLMWAKRDSRPLVKSAIDARLKVLVISPPPPPPAPPAWPVPPKG